MSEENNSTKKGVFNSNNWKVHLIYISIIFCLISVALISLMLVGDEGTFDIISFASTLLAIVLAVVAILITLWDVAGQNQNLYDVKNEVNKLRKISKQTKGFSDEISETVINVKELQSQNFDLLYSVKALIEENKDSTGSEELNEKLNNLISEIKTDLPSTAARVPFSNIQRDTLRIINENEPIESRQLYRILSEMYPDVNNRIFRMTLNRLERVQRITKSDNHYYINN